MTNHARREQHLFVCSNCERREPKWLGRCPNCGEWNSFRETNSSLKAVSKTTEPPSAIPLAEIETDPGLRVSAGNGELDRVLGGGFMRGSTTLIGGEPGVGKSTLLLQVAAELQTEGRVLYVGAEESAEQLRLRADHKLVVIEEWPSVAARFAGVSSIIKELARLASDASGGGELASQ